MDYILDAFDLTSLLIAFLGGVLIGIPTGPARFFVVGTFLNEGRNAAIRVYSGLFCAALIYAGLALLADDLISQNKKIEAVSYFIASLLLVFWGILIILKSKKKSKSSIQLNLQSWFLKGLIITLSNPIIPFIYLAFLQLLKLYSDEVSLLQKVLFILIFELFSFLSLSVVAWLLGKKRKDILGSWSTIKILMGILLIGFGAYNSFQQLDFSDGIRIKQNESFLEEQTDKVSGNVISIPELESDA